MAHVYYNENGNVVVNGVERKPKSMYELKEEEQKELNKKETHLYNIEPLLKALAKLDCGDNSCRFAQDKEDRISNIICTCLVNVDQSVRFELHRIWHNYLRKY